MGAADVALYFDEPDDPAADIVEAIAGVTVVRCDTEYWRRIGGARPKFKVTRQFRNIRHAYATSSLDWIAHIDADEFLRAPSGLEAAFQAFGRSRAFWMRIMPHERVWEREVDESGLFSGIFRAPLPGGEVETDEVYGPASELLYPVGMAGHQHGKPLTPTHSDLEPGIHFSFINDPFFKGTRWRAPSVRATEVQLLHFSGLTMRHFALKHLISAVQILDGQTPQMNSRTRIAISLLEAADPIEKSREWFEKYYVVEPEAAGKLASRGYLDRTELDLTAALRLHPSANELSLTHMAIDDRIEQELQETLQEVKSRR